MYQVMPRRIDQRKSNDTRKGTPLPHATKKWTKHRVRRFLNEVNPDYTQGKRISLACNYGVAMIADLHLKALKRDANEGEFEGEYSRHTKLKFGDKYVRGNANA